MEFRECLNECVKQLAPLYELKMVDVGFGKSEPLWYGGVKKGKDLKNAWPEII
jgi:hypothetical protein